MHTHKSREESNELWWENMSRDEAKKKKEESVTDCGHVAVHRAVRLRQRR
jgi:hypothetical protein